MGLYLINQHKILHNYEVERIDTWLPMLILEQKKIVTWPDLYSVLFNLINKI